MLREQFEIRPANQADLPGILAIKNHYIRTSSAMWYEHPLGEDDIVQWWQEHAGRKDRPIYVAVDLKSGGVIGYASLSAFRSHDGYRYTAENSVYLLPGYEGLGLARELMETAMEAGKAAGLKVVTAWIDGENQHSIDFHSALGFVLIGKMKNVGILRGRSRDVVIMDLEL